MTRWRCEECRAIHDDSELLTAQNPFDAAQDINGCPKCAAVDNFTQVCDVGGCEQEASCGWPSESGYRRTCFRHYNEGNP